MQIRNKTAKTIMAAMLSVIMALSMAACGSAGNNNTQSANNSTQNLTNAPQNQEPAGTTSAPEADPAAPESASGSETSENPEADTTSDNDKILVVYFSWSGHLDSMAHWVADETGGDLYRVTAKDPYPTDYNQTADRAKSEQDNGVRPEIVIDITEEQMAQYDTVFFGFPVWWYDLPMSMWTFLESYDFSGKTIIPFFSHEGSSNGANALPTVEKLAVGATVRSDDALSIRGGKVDGSESDVRAWVQGLGY